MVQTLVPLLHVPDVRSTVLWYIEIGFELHRMHEEDSRMNWALLTYENSELMVDSFGHSSTAARRELDLYIHTKDVQRLRRSLNSEIELIEDIHDTEYGMREFIIRDLNGFWIIFGQSI